MPVIELTGAQRLAVECGSPCLQIAACAGSGKTEVLALRAVRAVLRGASPESIIAFTFTEKAAEELKRRIDDRAGQRDERFVALPPSSSGLFAGTIHSYCFGLLRSSGACELYDVLTEERLWALLHRFARRLGLVDLLEAALPGRALSVRRAVDVFLENLLVVSSDSIPIDVVRCVAPEFASALERYERLTAAMRLLSFDQIVEKAVEGLRPGGPLRSLVEGRVREVFVDEYQDLNRAQEALLTALRELGANLTVVGDDDQAIYQWRGGDVSLFVSFPERHGGSLVTLAENHRSAPSIVRVSEAFARTIAPRVEKAMVASRPDCGPCVEIAIARDPEDEALQIARRIQRLLVDGHSPGDMAVLYRSVRTSAEPLVHALQNAGIPASVVGRVSLLDRAETRLLAHVFVMWAGGTWRPSEVEEFVRPDDVAEEIAAVTGKSRDEARRAVIRLRDMGQRLISRGVPNLARTYQEVLEVLGLPCGSDLDRARQERALGSMSGLLMDFEHSMKRVAPHAGPGLQWLDRTGLDTQAERAEERAVVEVLEAGAHEHLTRDASSSPGSAEGRPREASPAWDFATAHGRPVPGEVFLARLKVYLERFASQAVEETPEGVERDAGAVNIMTVHQAKGLEFPVVFVPCLVKGRFPSSRTGQGKTWYMPEDGEIRLFDRYRYEGHLADERRLFYVAMTRARELLVLSSFSEHRSKKACPSEFLRDLVSNEAVRGEVQPLGGVNPMAAVPAASRADGMVVDCGQLLVYSECPRKYYLRHVCGFAPSMAPEMGFGRVAHHAVCEMARRARSGGAPSLVEAERILEERFYLPFAGPAQQQAMLDVLRRRLRNYVKRHGADLERTLDVERQFEIPLERTRLRGRIDLLLRAPDLRPSSVEIVDLKTAENRPPIPQHLNQLRLYAKAVRALGLNPVGLAIHDLESDSGEVIPVEEDPRELGRFEDDLRCWIHGIRSASFSPRAGAGCRGCDFTRLCDGRPDSGMAR